MPCLVTNRQTWSRIALCERRCRSSSRLLLTACSAIGGERLRSAGRPARRPDARRHRSRPPSFPALRDAARPEVRLGFPEAEVARCPIRRRSSKSCDLKGKKIELIWRNLEPEEADPQAKEFVRQRRRSSSSRSRTHRSRPRRRRPRTRRIRSRSSSSIRPIRSATDWSRACLAPAGTSPESSAPRDVVAKQLELYQLLVPKLHRVLTLVDPTDPRTGRLLDAVPSGGGAAAATARARHPRSLDRDRISSACSTRCAPARSTARSSCRRASGSTTRR